MMSILAERQCVKFENSTRIDYLYMSGGPDGFVLCPADSDELRLLCAVRYMDSA